MRQIRKKGRSEPGARTLHDRLFKEFLWRFLPQFMQLFFPEQAARLNFQTARFIDKALVINFPEQELRITDIVAEVQSWQGETETLLIHLEVEGRDKRTLPQRMSEYYVLLRVSYGKAVLPIALVLLGNAGGLRWQEYQEELFGEPLLHFRYGQVGIRDLPAAAYLAKKEPIAATLALLMKTPKQQRAAVKLTALQTVIQSNLSPGDKLFLVELANTYAPTTTLSDPREEIMQALTEIDRSWGEKLREEGREEGELNGERKMLLRLLTLLFGPLPEAFVERIQAITDKTVLEDLRSQLVQVQKLEDLVLPELPPPSTPS
ncbi:MAG: DUF4351 domain-containing protein [Caldilineaceae bacterium]|nr:DUF4351 domain-containing protein [Caldilineaceae bacterium]